MTLPKSRQGLLPKFGGRICFPESLLSQSSNSISQLAVHCAREVRAVIASLTELIYWIIRIMFADHRKRRPEGRMQQSEVLKTQTAARLEPSMIEMAMGLH